MLDPPPLDSTLTLLERLRAGDGSARDILLERYLPVLRAWAHGRLPPSARGLADTDDLVQISLLGALKHLGHFEYRHEGAFLAYLRRILLNALRGEIRRATRRRTETGLSDSVPDLGASVVDWVAGRETMERYERALGELGEDQRIAVMLRLEFDFTYAQVAEALGRPTEDAARMYVTRAIAQLAKIMGGQRG
jgi:RNA polymerase sigma-70 factor (ECF subfamily)